MSLALTRWSHVSDRAFRVLIRMALTALDEPAHGNPANLYFGGRDLLAMTLRVERGGDASTAYRRVRFAVTELIEAGAIERTNAARAGANQVYRLQLSGVRTIDQLPLPAAQEEPHVPPHRDPESTPEPVQGEPSVPPQEESHVPPEGEPSGTSRGNATYPPRNQEEPVEELLEEREGVDLRTDVTGPRVHEAHANLDLSLPTLCEHGLTSRLRADGKPSCALCRRGLPAADTRLAQVIQIRTAS